MGKLDTIEKIIDYQKICTIASIDNEGFPNIKAMLKPRMRNGLKEIYLTTNTSSLKVSSFKRNNKGCLYFYDDRFFRGVMFNGFVEILEDQETKNMIWQAGDEMYYPEGVSDPDYCVIKFTTKSIRYYSNFKSETFEI